MNASRQPVGAPRARKAPAIAARRPGIGPYIRRATTRRRRACGCRTRCPCGRPSSSPSARRPRSPPSTWARSFDHLVAQASRFLEIHVSGTRTAMSSSIDEMMRSTSSRESSASSLFTCSAVVLPTSSFGDVAHDVVDGLADGLRLDAVLLVVRPSGCRGAGASRRWPARMESVMLVGVHDHLPRNVARRAADGLDERAVVAQEAFLVGIQDGHERHLGQVEALAQQVDAHEHVELAAAQIAQDLRRARGWRCPECM